MAPAQLSLGADSTVQKCSDNLGNFVRKNLNSLSEFGESAYQRLDMFNEQAKPLKGIDEVAVDVTESRRNADARVAAKDDPDATECSSSFADTTSGDENCFGLSDAEVESQFYGSYDGLGGLFPTRKKKLTSHWRNYIHPLMWRCKWTELKIKQFESQASKYSRKLAAYDQEKLMAFDQSRTEEFGSRSLPYTSHSKSRKPLKRRKRKRVEYTTDMAAYLANHNLFSCRENKKHDQDGTSTGDDLVNPVMCTRPNHTGSDEFGLNDDWSIHEGSMNFEEEILRKIDLIYSRVHMLKAKVDSVMTKYAGKFSSSESLSHLVPCCDAQTSSVRSPTFSACNGDTVSVGGLYASFPQLSDCELEDFVMPDAALSNYGVDILIPDIIESTVGLLSSTDVTQHQSQVGDSCEKIVDNILIHNEAVKAEVQTPKQSHDHDADDVSEDEITNSSLPLEDQVPKTILSHEKSSTLKRCLASDINFPRSKRKRGERKAGSGSWSRQLPGEPDSL